jgi:hypothetical protein
MIKKFFWGLAFLSLVLIGGCASDEDNSALPQLPTISGMTPAQVKNGDRNVAGLISGTNFTGVTDVNLGPGITVANFQATSPTEIAVAFSVGDSAAAGPRTITVTTAGGTASSSSVLSVLIGNKPPVAAFSVSPGQGSTTTTFVFDASRSRDPDGRIVEFRWDFADGKRANGKKVEHRFANAGSFQVKLEVEDNKGFAIQEKRTLKVEKFRAQACTRKLPYKRVGIFGTVIAVNGNKYTFRTDGDHTCQTAFYRCGDFSPPPENRYFGTVCSMTYFGDRLFEIGVINAKNRPQPGERAFIKAQNCRFDPCR